MSDIPTRDDWRFDEECPRCGEDTHIGAILPPGVSEADAEAVEMVCGTDVSSGTGVEGPGCGHIWEWSADA